MAVEKHFWGTQGGRDVFLFTLSSEAGVCVRVSNYGGIIQSFQAEDRQGNWIDAVLGYDTLEEYIQGSQFFGAAVGPVADRIARGTCQLAGQQVTLPQNAGRDCMHSGPNGFHATLWDWKTLEDALELSHTFRGCDRGFPGDLEVTIQYRLSPSGSLQIDYWARCSEETAVSFTNHSYFNLDGGARDCLAQKIRVCASSYAQTSGGEDPVCTGAESRVEGTPMDLRRPKTVAAILAHRDWEEFRSAGGLDHYFPVDGTGMRCHASIESEESGLILTCCSDAPGVLVYTGNGLDRERGKGGSIYAKHWGVCLETECFPNAVNLPRLRQQVLLCPREEFRTRTVYEIRKG